MKKYFVFGLTGMFMLFFALSANYLFSSEGESVANQEVVEKSFPVVPVSTDASFLSYDLDANAPVVNYCRFVPCAAYCNPQFICRPNQAFGPVCYFQPFPVPSNNCGEPIPCCPPRE